MLKHENLGVRLLEFHRLTNRMSRLVRRRLVPLQFLLVGLAFIWPPALTFAFINTGILLVLMGAFIVIDDRRMKLEQRTLLREPD